jgi:adenylosuccinate lyase
VGIRALTVEEKAVLRALPQISLEDAQRVKKMEREGHDGIHATNHDVKAAEYFVKQKLKGTSLADVVEWVHFALTSEDVNSVAYSLGLRSGIEKVTLRPRR